VPYDATETCTPEDYDLTGIHNIYCFFSSDFVEFLFLSRPPFDWSYESSNGKISRAIFDLRAGTQVFGGSLYFDTSKLEDGTPRFLNMIVSLLKPFIYELSLTVTVGETSVGSGFVTRGKPFQIYIGDVSVGQGIFPVTKSFDVMIGDTQVGEGS